MALPVKYCAHPFLSLSHPFSNNLTLPAKSAAAEVEGAGKASLGAEAGLGAGVDPAVHSGVGAGSEVRSKVGAGSGVRSGAGEHEEGGAVETTG